MILCVFHVRIIILKSLFHGLMEKLNSNHILNTGFAAYQPLGNSCGTPIHQLLFADSNQQTVLNQPNFNNVPGTNQQQMSNITFPMNQQMQNLHPNHFISNAATTYNPLMFSSGFVSTQPQFNQYYQGPVSNSGRFIKIGQLKILFCLWL